MAKKIKAVDYLQQCATSGVAAYALGLSAMRAAVLEGVATTEFSGEEAGNAEHAKLMAWARENLKSIEGAISAVGNILRKAASVALVPNAIGKIQTGSGEKAATQEVTAGEIKTRRELSAVAEAANKVLGRAKQPGSGKTKSAPTLTDAETAKKAAEAHKAAALAEQASIETAERSAMQLAEIIRNAFDGKHGAHRQTIVDALASVGFKLAPLTKAAPAPEVSKVTKAAPAPKAKAKAKGQRPSA